MYVHDPPLPIPAKKKKGSVRSHVICFFSGCGLDFSENVEYTNPQVCNQGKKMDNCSFAIWQAKIEFHP